MQRYRCNVWDRKSETDSEGNIYVGKLWAMLAYNADSGKLYETRDGKRWPNEYRDEFTYRDRENATLDEYLARIEYYRKRGYLIRPYIDARPLIDTEWR